MLFTFIIKGRVLDNRKLLSSGYAAGSIPSTGLARLPLLLQDQFALVKIDVPQCG